MKTSIRFLRKKKGMTLEELSEKTHITAAHLSMIERDKREPSIQTLDRIAQALEVDTEVFWWNTVESPTGNDAEYDLVRLEDRKVYHGVYNDKLIYEYVTNAASEDDTNWNSMEGYIAKISPEGPERSAEGLREEKNGFGEGGEAVCLEKTVYLPPNPPCRKPRRAGTGDFVQK